MKKDAAVLIGLQFGDEGKARIIDYLAKDVDVVIRFNGGANAGHTIEHKDIRLIQHQIPSGVFNKKSLLYIGSGCVVNPLKTVSEIVEIEKKGFNLGKRLKISAKATLVLPDHVYVDKCEGKELGTTGNGVGNAYAAQALRSRNGELENIRVGDYSSELAEVIASRLQKAAKEKKVPVDVASEVRVFMAALKKIQKYVVSDALFAENLARSGKRILFEGAQSTMLDVIQGTVPYVTSSRTISAAAYTGGDVSIIHHKKVIGVAKAIMSRVGNGPFISEFGGRKSEVYCAENFGMAHTKEKEAVKYASENLLKSKDYLNIGIALRMLGNEYGATTKRPRRIGMLDVALLRQNCLLNGVDELYINKFDCLCDFNRTSLPGIPVVVGYKLKGKKINYIPSTVRDQYAAVPVVKYFPKISEELLSCKSKNKLPLAAKKLISFIEQETKTKIKGIGIGPKREQFVAL